MFSLSYWTLKITANIVLVFKLLKQQLTERNRVVPTPERTTQTVTTRNG